MYKLLCRVWDRMTMLFLRGIEFIPRPYASSIPKRAQIWYLVKLKEIQIWTWCDMFENHIEPILVPSYSCLTTKSNPLNCLLRLTFIHCAQMLKQVIRYYRINRRIKVCLILQNRLIEGNKSSSLVVCIEFITSKINDYESENPKHYCSHARYLNGSL